MRLFVLSQVKAGKMSDDRENRKSVREEHGERGKIEPERGGSGDRGRG